MASDLVLGNDQVMDDPVGVGSNGVSEDDGNDAQGLLRDRNVRERSDVVTPCPRAV